VQRILLVDDYGPQLAAWKRELEEDGRLVVAVTNKADAIECAKQQAPDVAIIDLYLGLDDGLDCLRALKAIAPDLFAVVVSADMSVAYAMAAVRAGADDVYVKPLIVRDVVRRIVQGESLDPARTSLTLDEVEWEHINRALVESGKNITQAAERLGIYRQTLQRKLRRRGRERVGDDS
jgi:two-component system response regulator RegA